MDTLPSAVARFAAAVAVVLIGTLPVQAQLTLCRCAVDDLPEVGELPGEVFAAAKL